MLAAHGIANQNVSRVSSMQSMLGNTELPETGAFDFFNYLLGLQVNSADPLQNQDALFTGIGGNADSLKSEDPIQALFEKKEQPLWNPLFPTVGGTNQNLQVLSLKNPGEEKVQNPTVSFDLSSDKTTTQNSKSLENRLLEPNLFLETKENRVDANVQIDDPSDGVSFDGLVDKNAKSQNEQKSLGIEKKIDTSLLETQQVRQRENLNITQGTPQEVDQGNVRSEVVNASTEGIKPSEKKKVEDQDSPWVVLNSSVQTSKSSDGSPAGQQEIHVREKATLPQVFQKVETMVHHGGGKMIVELSPPELGKLEVEVVTKGNKVEIKMRSDNDVAKVALESHMGELKSAMEGQNLTLHKVEVQVGLDHGSSFQRGQFAAFSGQEQNGSSRQNFSQSRRNATLSYSGPEARIPTVSRAAAPAVRGGVDLKI